MISKVKLAGKYLDQPLLISKFKTAVTPVFIGGSALYGAHEIYKAPKEERKKKNCNKYYLYNDSNCCICTCST